MTTRLLLAFALFACSSPAKSGMSTTPPGGNPGSGTLQGTVQFVGTPCEAAKKGPPCDGPYPDYEVVVYKDDGTTVASTAKTDQDGKFTVSLPEGKYVIFTGANAAAGADAKQRTDVVVSRDALQTVDLRIDSGVRSDAAPSH
jgi:hypothetical protein